jgi:hypothetical protein
MTRDTKKEDSEVHIPIFGFLGAEAAEKLSATLRDSPPGEFVKVDCPYDTCPYRHHLDNPGAVCAYDAVIAQARYQEVKTGKDRQEVHHCFRVEVMVRRPMDAKGNDPDGKPVFGWSRKPPLDLSFPEEHHPTRNQTDKRKE